MSSPRSAPDRPSRRRAAPPEPDGEILTVDGVPLHFQRSGRGPAVVLLHGASGNLRDWTLGAAAAMAEDHSVIAFDRPGLGFSGRVRGGRRLTVQAGLMRAALARLGITRASLVGHSYGGAVALAWALAAPASVTGLLLLGTPSQPRGRLSLMTGLLANILTGPLLARNVPGRVADRLAGRAVTRIFAPQPAPAGYLAHMRPDLLLQPATIRANALQLKALKAQLRAMAARYPDIAVPVEILHGSADAVVPLEVHALPLARQIPNARLTRLEGVGHMPQHAALPEVLAALHRLCKAT